MPRKKKPKVAHATARTVYIPNDLTRPLTRLATLTGLSANELISEAIRTCYGPTKSPTLSQAALNLYLETATRHHQQRKRAIAADIAASNALETSRTKLRSLQAARARKSAVKPPAAEAA